MEHERLYHTAIAPLSIEMGERLGNYVLLDELGRGSSGVVWLAAQEPHGREVALKVLGERGASSGWGGSARHRARFHREVEIASMLDHPNIARVHDSGFEDGVPYLVMDLVEGKALDVYVKEAGLEQREVVTLMKSVAEGVQHAHQHGVIHRDLKPANILVTKDGSPQILDFGLAKAIDASEEGAASALVSFEGEVVGTPIYMAPEQASGKSGEVDTRVDVYALGVTLYQLLTDRFPHDPSGSSIEVLRRISETDILRPSQADERLRGDLEALLLKALAKDPEDRYSSAGDLAADLGRYLKREPLQARPANTVYFLTRHFIRNWKMWSAVACLVLLAGAGIARYVYDTKAFSQTERELRSTLAIGASAAELRSATGSLASGEIDEVYRVVAAAIEQNPDNLAAATLGGMMLKQTGHLLPLTELLPHAGTGVVDVCFALKAPVYATCDGVNVRIYGEEGDQLRSPVLHQKSPVVRMQLSAMGTALVTMHQDETLAVWSHADAWASPKILSGVTGDRLAISENDRWIGWIDPERKAQLWEWQSEHEPVIPKSMLQGGLFGDLVAESCEHLLFDPLNRYVLLKQGDFRSLLWNLELSSLVATTTESGMGMMPPAAQVYRFSRDGKAFLTFKKGMHVVQAYHLPETTLTSVTTLATNLYKNEHGYSGATFLPNDSNKVALIGEREISVSDLAADHSSYLTPEGLVWPRAMSVSADGGTIAVTGTEVSVHILNVVTGRAVVSPIKYPWSIRSLGLNGDGTRLVLLDVRGKLSVWDCQTGHQLGIVQSMIVGDHEVAFSQSDQFILVREPNGSTIAWRYTDSLHSPTVIEDKDPITALNLSPDGSKLVASWPRSARLFETLSGRSLTKHMKHMCQKNQGSIYNKYLVRRDAAFHPSGKAFFLRPDYKEIQMFDLQGAPAGPRTKFRNSFPSLLVDPINGAFVCSVSWRHVTVWDCLSGEILWATPDETEIDTINASLSTLGTHILVTNDVRLTEVWDLKTTDKVFSGSLHHTNLSDIAWNADDSLMATSAENGEIKVLSTEDWKEQAVFGHRREVSKLDFHLDKPLLLSASLDGTVELWDVEARGGYGRSMFHASGVRWAAFSPDGDHLATACEDGTVRLWDTLTQRQICLPIRHPDSVEKVVFHPGGEHLITLCDDGKVRVWPIFVARSTAPAWFPGLLRGVSGLSPGGLNTWRGGLDGSYRELVEEFLGN